MSELKEYYVNYSYGAASCTTVMATGLEEAIDLAYNHDKAYTPSICHHCSSNVDIGDLDGIIITSQDSDDDLFDDTYDKVLLDQYSLAKRKLNWLLSKVGIDKNGVFLTSGNTSLDIKESDEFLNIHVKEEANK